MSAEFIDIQWLGQNGFRIHARDITLYLDPYLSTYCEQKTCHSPNIRHIRMSPIVLDPGQINDCDYLLISHDHIDHLDPWTLEPLLKASPHCRVIAPRAAEQTIKSLGASHCFFLSGNDSINFNDLVVEAIPGKHNEYDFNEKNGYPYLTYLIYFMGFKIYFAGDTLLFDQLIQRLKKSNPHIAFLPINGWDTERRKLGFKSNMNYKDACYLAKVMDAEITIPMHYDMFTINTEDVEKFRKAMDKNPGIDSYKILKVGEHFQFMKSY